MTRFTHLADWLAWQESCHPQAIDLTLERVRDVAAKMGLLSPRTKIITVAGTNGKGSCVKALEVLLSESGAKVGCYTSPHLQRYNERVRIGGQPAADQNLCRAFDAVDQARGETTLTYFEFGTLAAFYLFAEANLDYWVLEVGLGGRLDATNVLDADITVITPIALDHTEWLGPDRESIGREKAGICRPAAPLVCADPEPPVSVTRIAQQLGCAYHGLQRAFGYQRQGGQTRFWVGQNFACEAQTQLPAPSLAAALKVLDLLSLLPGGGPGALSLDRLQEALGALSLPGRCQHVALSEGRWGVLDVAHNAAAVDYLAEELARRYPQQTFSLVLAMMADKDIRGSIERLAPLADRWFVATIPGLERAATVEFLASEVRDCLGAKTPVEQCDTVETAMALALEQNPQAPLLVTGSFYTIAAALAFQSAPGDGEPGNG